MIFLLKIVVFLIVIALALWWDVKWKKRFFRKISYLLVKKDIGKPIFIEEDGKITCGF